MTIIIRQADITDKDAWNNYIFSRDDASPYHNFSWVQSVEKAYGFKNLSLIAIDDDVVVGVLPIIHMQRPFLAGSLCSLPYCDVGYAVANDQDIENKLLDKLNELKLSTRSKQIEYRDQVSIENTDFNDISQLAEQKVRMILPLPGSSEILQKNFKSKLRSQIRKAEKNGLTYQVGSSNELLDSFYKVFIVNMRKLGSPVHSKLLFQALLGNYQDNMLISIVYKDNVVPVGAGIVLRNNNIACIPWASTLPEYNRLAPNMLLYWSLLKEVTDSGCNEFDFGRSTFNEGTYKFKKQWGAMPVLLNWTLPGTKVSPDESEAGKSKTREFFEICWRKLPLGLTTRIGPMIRKYVSL